MSIETGGGAVVGGSANVGANFIGRDYVEINPDQPAGDRLRDLETAVFGDRRIGYPGLMSELSRLHAEIGRLNRQIEAMSMRRGISEGLTLLLSILTVVLILTRGT